jgi:hypothetical protein
MAKRITITVGVSREHHALLTAIAKAGRHGTLQLAAEIALERYGQHFGLAVADCREGDTAQNERANQPTSPATVS